MKAIVGAILLCWAAAAQPNWVQLSPSTVPPGREAGVMAYDGARQQIVMFGGAIISGSIFIDGNDTWLWDGQNWHATSPLTKPSGRSRPCIIYDPRIQKVVMFGGANTDVLGDTWLWDGTNWALQDTSAGAPPAGAWYSSFGFDELRQQAILFTAADFTSFTSQTWSWNGTGWTQLHPATNPPYSGTPLMAYDRARGELVLETYTDNPTNNNLASTWAWSGTNWVRKPPSGDHLPYDPNPGQAVYDAVHQQVLVFLQAQQTWAWDGTAWSLLHPAASPSDRILMAEAFDEVNQRVVGFGGGINVAPFLGNDTWVYTDPTPTVHITVPLGTSFTFNGITYTGSHAIQVSAGTYTLSTTSPQATASATQLVFSNWSDGGAISHSITVPLGGVNLTATFGTQYNLSTVANPISGGTVSGGGFYDAGTTASPTASPNAGFSFANWSNACSGSGACSVVMNAPATVTANFNASLIQFTVNVPAAVQFTFNGTTYTGTQTIAVPPGPYTLSTTTPQATVAGTQLAFASWSDGGAISHTVTLSGAAQSITGTFHTQYLLTTSALPVTEGVVAPLSGGPYFDSGSVVSVGSVANPGFQFQYWTGACVGSAPVCQVLMSAPLTVVGNFTVTPKWIQLGPANSPQARHSSAMAFDAGRNEMVLFGGIASPSYMGDTWAWNGTNWNLRSSAGPSPRAGVALAYDPAHGQIVMFGGTTPASLLNETWIWDGNAGVWTEQHPAVSPSPRYFASLAWDGTRLILFGGLTITNAGAVNDTWTWTGSNWVQLTPATSPPARGLAPMTYDAARNQVVLFGGQNAGYLGDTWIWSGSNWVAMAPVTHPIARSAAAFAYDPVIQQSVLFAGANVAFPDEVWLWDGANWKSAPESPSPSDRYAGAMAYDPARQQVLLFGGFTSASEGDTWIFANNAVQQFYTLTTAANPVGAGTITAVSPGQAGPSYRAGSTVTLTASSTPAAPFGYWSGACSGSTCTVTMTSNESVIANYPPPPKWVQVSLPTMLTGRSYAPLVFDSGRNQTILFGGLQEATGAYFNETWIWDGTTWTQRFPLNYPSPRYGHAMGYDPVNHVTILYGGQVAGGFSSITWMWDGSSWVGLITDHRPPAGFGSTMAWDGSHLILFGGQAANGVVQNDTWAWTGGDWMLLSPASRPPARQLAVMTYDAARNQVVLFGGETSNFSGFLGDTWVWDGTNWTQKVLATSPTARSRAVMAYQGVIQKVVLFSGDSVVSTGDTWLWDGNSWTQRIEDPSPSWQFGSAMVYDSARQQIVLLVHYASDVRETWLYANNVVQQYFTINTTVNPAGSGTLALKSFEGVGPLWRAGSSVDVIPTPAAGNEFQGWTGGCSGSSSFCTLTMTGNQTVGAKFGFPLSWLQLNPATNAAPKGNLIFQNPISMAFDVTRQQVVYFGGSAGDQTWTWNGTTWTRRTPAHSPSARSGHAMAYDAARQRVILFGGGANMLAVNDTWAWDGSDWTLVDAGTGPARRFNHAMAYDRVRQEIVMFGGVDENLNFYPDTWAWNGAQWILRQASGGPPVRSDFGMAFDPVNAEVVISSGIEGQNDTWGWNGSVWTRKFPSHLPPSTSSHFCQMAYDERLQRTVLLIDNYALGPQTWMWDGTDWTQLAPTQNPTPRAASGIVYDGVRGQVLLFGGDSFPSFLNDTWVLAPPAAILNLQSVSATKNAAGNYLVTFALKNTGNTAANAVFGFSATAVTLVGGASTTTNTFPLGQFSNIAPGTSGTFQAQFPASAGSGAHTFSAQGGYGTVGGGAGGGNWSIAVRSVVFP